MNARSSELEEIFSQRRATFLVGAGASRSMCDKAKTWPELIKSGAAFLDQSNGGGDAIRKVVDAAEGDSDVYISAAGLLRKKLGPAFGNWLRDEFETMPIDNSSLGECFKRYNRTILTTNYDSLLEQATGLPSCTWQEPERFRMALSGESPAVVHLHGIWNAPQSVIFTPQDYDRVKNATGSQVLQKAISLLDRLVMVGCGDGLDDGNIGELLKWLSEEFSTQVRPFNLMRGDVREDANLPYVPFSYGKAHEDLVGYLERLTDLGDGQVARENEQKRSSIDLARRRVTSPLREMTLRTSIGDLDDVEPVELVLEPILLPVPNEDFVSSRTDGDSVYERYNPRAEALENRHILVVGDENSGLTTTLRWMVATRHDQDHDAFALYIDYRTLRTGVGALKRAVARELESTGYLLAKKDGNQAFPALVLGIDNVSVGASSKFKRLLQDLEDLGPTFVVIGARDGDQIEVDHRLREVFSSLRVMFVGRLNQADIGRLTDLIAPGAEGDVAHTATRIIREQGLQRDFFTVALLISALVSGDQLANTGSQTRLLDEYLKQLLGRGESRDDSRLGLASEGLSDLLVALARGYVRANSGALPSSRVTEIIEETLAAFDWSENASEAVSELVRRRVLRYHGNSVAFAQASYLHLYAAKAAMEDGAFREELFESPLKYSRIITHYVSLARGDTAALRMIEALLGVDDFANSAPRLGQEHADPVMDAKSVEDLVAALENVDDVVSDVDLAGDDEEEEWAPSDSLETLGDPDPEPFPVQDPAELAPLRRVMLILSLSSNVLRDSEKLTDLTQKQAVLERLLFVWAHFVQVLEADHAFAGFTHNLYEQLISSGEIPAHDGPVAADNFNSILACLMAYSGMQSTLATKKLENSLNRLFDQKEFASDPQKAVMGALLALAIEDIDWAKIFLKVQEEHPRKWGVSFPLLGLAQGLYLQDRVPEAFSKKVEDFVVKQMLTRLGLRGRDAKRADAGLRSRLQREKERHRQIQAQAERRSLPANEPPA